jgi:hypothetical protein
MASICYRRRTRLSRQLLNFPENVFITQPAYFITDQAVSNLDYLATQRHAGIEVLLPARSHYGAVSGIPRSKVFRNTWTLAARLPVHYEHAIHHGRTSASGGSFRIHSREGLQHDCPALHSQQWGAGINNFGSNVFPGITIVDDLGNDSPLEYQFRFQRGDHHRLDGSFAGRLHRYFQNRWMPSANAIWNHGKHTVTFGGSFSYTQLNARDERTNARA